ncbi:NAD(P)-dependent oxidoreductase [Georgenia deserti]|uniref:NAD(P)-dependent oxidoreductase n=1 Tax=Georgenia deserti TaxID=2093781 RepID=A0ABW4L6Y1_9MICO
MRITVIGATGMVGRRVTSEAAARGHHVVAVSRTARPEAGRSPYKVTVLTADVADTTAMQSAMDGSDAAVLAVRPEPGHEVALLPELTRSALTAAHDAGVRLLVVGGAGPLRSPRHPGRTVVDDPDHVAPPWRALAAASAAQLQECRSHPGGDWTYLSPPAVLAPGARSGRYRTGTDGVLLTDASGNSRISAQDLAVAVVDELESPGAPRWFTVAVV